MQKSNDNQQINALFDVVKQCGVWATSLVNFMKYLYLFSDYFMVGWSFLQQNQSKCIWLMGFKNPKSHGDIMKTVNIFSIISKVTKLAKHLERKFMLSSHTKPLEDLISSVSRYICKYNYKLKTQRISNLRLHEN